MNRAWQGCQIGRVAFHLFFKTNPPRKSSFIKMIFICRKTHVQTNIFHKAGFAAKTRFHIEADSNSKLSICQILYFVGHTPLLNSKNSNNSTQNWTSLELPHSTIYISIEVPLELVTNSFEMKEKSKPTLVKMASKRASDKTYYQNNKMNA